MSITILTVCSGNVCRSPLAEQLLRVGLQDFEGVSVSSAGTIALIGAGMPPPAAALSARFGAKDAAAHRARQLEERFVREADLVLGLSREHRGAIVELVPAAIRKTFTLREFGHIAASIADDDLDDAVSPLDANQVEHRMRAAVAAAASLRGVVPPLGSTDDADVLDPYGRSAQAFEASAAQLVPAVRAAVALLERASRRA